MLKHFVHVKKLKRCTVLCIPDHNLWIARCGGPVIHKSKVKHKAARTVSEHIFLARAVAIMKYFRRKTFVPVPGVLLYDLYPRNTLSTSYSKSGGNAYLYQFDLRAVITESDILKIYCQLMRISAELHATTLDCVR